MKLTQYIEENRRSWSQGTRKRSKQWDLLLDAIEKNPEATIAELAQCLGWSEAKAKGIYHRVRRAGLVKKLRLVQK